VSSPPVLALVGPTASGKSAVALEVANVTGAEIVAVDAFTVYRGMDVGTAKPTVEERRQVPHHMVDVLDPEEECTVGWFQPRARAAIDGVLARGGLPLLVGGSGLYFRAVVDDLRFPPTDPEVRAALERAHADDPQAAHALLTRHDPQAAARIDPDNLRRTVRALEVIELTGRPFSDWRDAWDRHESVYPGLSVVGVDVDRADLETRIRARVQAMLAAGLVDECRRLSRRRLSSSARQAIGYREMFAHLDGDVGLQDTTDRIRARTRRYAVRQQRWFRADPRVEWSVQERSGELLLRQVP
jgi:tRNA dimethylallyltransferase